MGESRVIAQEQLRAPDDLRRDRQVALSGEIVNIVPRRKTGHVITSCAVSTGSHEEDMPVESIDPSRRDRSELVDHPRLVRLGRPWRDAGDDRFCRTEENV